MFAEPYTNETILRNVVANNQARCPPPFLQQDIYCIFYSLFRMKYSPNFCLGPTLHRSLRNSCSGAIDGWILPQVSYSIVTHTTGTVNSTLPEIMQHHPRYYQIVHAHGCRFLRNCASSVYTVLVAGVISKKTFTSQAVSLRN